MISMASSLLELCRLDKLCYFYTVNADTTKYSVVDFDQAEANLETTHCHYDYAVRITF